MTHVIDRPVRPTERPRATRREDLLTMAFATWLILGIFVDGWAHENDKPESFFTPWHALFYSGAAATALRMAWMVRRRRGTGATLRSSVPMGYGLGLVGVAVFAFGGLFDMVWHQAFGIEVGLEALLSPSHLVLFCGALLVSTSPLRAGWHDPDLHAPTFRRFLPVLLSSTFATAGVAFFFMNFAPWLTGAMTDTPYDYIAANFDGETASWMVEEIHIEGYAAILATTVILVTPVLLLARRWVLPFGTMTFLLGTVGALVASIESFDMGPVFVAAAVGGLGGDVLYRRLRPTPARPRKMRYVAAGLPLGMWFAYFALLGLTATVGWSIELWSGVSVMSALLGLGLALLAFPPEIPDPRTAADEY